MNTKLATLQESKQPYKNPKITIGNYKIKSNGQAWVLLRHNTEIGNNTLLSNIINQVLRDNDLDAKTKESFKELLPTVERLQLSPIEPKTTAKDIPLGSLKLTANKNAWVLVQGKPVDEDMGKEKYNTKYLDSAITLAIEHEAKNSRTHDLINAYAKAQAKVIAALNKSIKTLNKLAFIRGVTYAQ
jgi:hypothetical protein